MLRHAVATSLLLALPLPVSASIGEGQPLRTLCSSPTMDYCLSIWTWDWVYEYGAPQFESGFGTVRFTSMVELFGHAVKEGQANFSGFFALNTGGDDFYLQAMGAGTPFETLWDTSPANLLHRTPSVHEDLGTVVFRTDDRFNFIAACSARAETNGERCYEPVSVPEPASMLLLVTGLVCVATVRHTRREG